MNPHLFIVSTQDMRSMAMLGVQPGSPTRLDRTPITADSPQHVHLVICGMSPQAQSLAIQAALVAHYPNYCRDHSLRTRITLIGDSPVEVDYIQKRCHTLLCHSYRRIIRTDGNHIACNTFLPYYHGQRDDFVDIEWDFICGRLQDRALRHLLQRWAHDETRLLTIACCYPKDSRCQREAHLLRSLPDIPIWIPTDDRPLPDITRFRRAADRIRQAYQEARGIDAEQPIPIRELQSGFYHAMSCTTKLRSLGYTEDTWGTLTTLSERDVELLTEVEHNRWSVAELIMGYRPTTDEEHRLILQDTTMRSQLKSQLVHDDLRSFRELGCDETGRNVARYDAYLIRQLPLLASILQNTPTQP